MSGVLVVAEVGLVLADHTVVLEQTTIKLSILRDQSVHRIDTLIQLGL